MCSGEFMIAPEDLFRALSSVKISATEILCALSTFLFALLPACNSEERKSKILFGETPPYFFDEIPSSLKLYYNLYFTVSSFLLHNIKVKQITHKKCAHLN